MPAASGDAQAANRGQVNQLLVVADGPRTWLVGSGPSPAFGRRLACVLKAQTGRRVTDVLSPWAHPELVLGVAGLPAPAPRHWAHVQVAEAMAERCPRCVERLRQRLGEAAVDLEAGAAPGVQDPVRVPERRFDGEHGRLGPFEWWRLWRAPTQPVIVWRLLRAPIWQASGLINGDGPPDARDADLAELAASTSRLASLIAQAGPPAARVIGDQGPVRGAEWPALQARYWAELLAAVGQAIESGAAETAAPAPWPGLPDGWSAHPWHALNWQRAWRQVEPQVLGMPLPPSPTAPPAPPSVAAPLPR